MIIDSATAVYTTMKHMTTMLSSIEWLIEDLNIPEELELERELKAAIQDLSSYAYDHSSKKGSKP